MLHQGTATNKNSLTKVLFTLQPMSVSLMEQVLFPFAVLDGYED
jgi:hypothetical protein